MNGSGNTETPATMGGGHVDSEVQILHGNGRTEAISNEGTELSGGAEVGQEPAKESPEIQAPKSKGGQRKISDEEKNARLEATIKNSLENGLASYNGVEIKKLYPKTYKILTDYMSDKAGISGMMDEETILGVLLYSPRIVLFDFFDTNKILVNTEAVKDGWHYNVQAQNIQLVSNQAFENRLRAEIPGFMKAFEILEQKLNT